MLQFMPQALTMRRILFGVFFIEFLVLAVTENPMENEDLFEGDINIPELASAAQEEKDVYSVALGARKTGQWPDAIMPYEIDISDSKGIDAIHEAMDEWEEKTCVLFFKRSDENNYVKFITGQGGCWSNGIGRNGNGMQLINLDPGCWRKGTVVHEIGHALGFWHEQSRPDRDDYVTIMWDNIKKGLAGQFKKYSRKIIDSLKVPYDYASIMHYSRKAFTKSSKLDTIVPKKSGVTIGQRSGLSELDALQANRLYKCDLVTDAPPTTIPKVQRGNIGYIIHLQSKKCLSPLGGKVPGEGHPVVASSDCDEPQSFFDMSPGGVLKHVVSGMCLHPTGSCTLPDDNTELVLSKVCDNPKIKMAIYGDGRFEHKISEACVRPVQGWDKVPSGTRFVTHSECNIDKYAFGFAVARPTEKNLALGKKAYQSSTFNRAAASRAVDGKRSGDYLDKTCTHTYFSKSPWWRVDLGKENKVNTIYVSNRGDCCWGRISNFQIAIGNSLSSRGRSNAKCGGKHSLKRGETKKFECDPALNGRYVTIFIHSNTYIPLTLCEVEVYNEPERPKTTPSTTGSQSVIQHSSSKLCILPKHDRVDNNSAVVLAPRCSESLAKFRSHSNGSLEHIASGMCLAPKDGCSGVPEDTEVVLLDQCGSEGTTFMFDDDGSLVHYQSDMCVRPSTSAVTSKQTTMLVLSEECDGEKHGFSMTTVPITLPTKGTTNEGSCGRVWLKSTMVIGGVDAKPGSWPWQVALLKRGRFTCGGSLIKKDWVVTAAHCVNPSDKPEDMTVVLGDFNRNKAEGREVRIQVKKFLRHSGYYKPSPINNDVALLQLKQPVQLNHYINTVCLPQQNYKLPAGTTCYITGWGKIRHPGSSHPILQQAEMRTVSNTDCSNRLKRIPSMSSLKITEQMLCAGNKDVVISGCHGDSGGPFVCKDEHSRWFLQGAVSWGDSSCSSSKFYTVFARLGKFRDWIEKQVGSLGA